LPKNANGPSRNRDCPLAETVPSQRLSPRKDCLSRQRLSLSDCPCTDCPSQTPGQKSLPRGLSLLDRPGRRTSTGLSSHTFTRLSPASVAAFFGRSARALERALLRARASARGKNHPPPVTTLRNHGARPGSPRPGHARVTMGLRRPNDLSCLLSR